MNDDESDYHQNTLCHPIINSDFNQHHISNHYRFIVFHMHLFIVTDLTVCNYIIPHH